MNQRPTRRLAATCLVLVLAGCAAVPATRPDTVPPAVPPRAATLVDSASGRTLSAAEVAQRAALADVVLLGELHGHPVGLPAAADLFERLVRLNPRTTALGLEFYERDQQVHLDDYLTGVTNEEAFRAATGKTAEKDSHRPLIETAKNAGLRVWALNAPRRYVRLARTDGFSAFERFTDEQRRLLDVPGALTEGRYAEEFYGLMGDMGGHGETESAGPSEMAVSFFRSQNVWDATMADTAVAALDAGARPLVIIVGRFHTDFEGGLVERLRDRAPGARILTLSVADTQSDTLADEDLGRADFILYAGPAE